jgi:hypothetical protein
VIVHASDGLEFLWHHRQPPRYGCLASSFYAATGDARFLDHIAEVQNWRLVALAHALGYVNLTAFHGLNTVQMTPELWDVHAEYIPDNAMNRYVADVWSLTIPGVHHSVCIAVGRWQGSLEYYVSDSQRDGIMQFSYPEQFYASEYGAPFELSMIARPEQVLQWFPFVEPLEQLAKVYPAYREVAS